MGHNIHAQCQKTAFGNGCIGIIYVLKNYSSMSKQSRQRRKSSTSDATTTIRSRRGRSQVRIPIRSDVHVGNSTSPYHISETQDKRWKAIMAGARDRIVIDGMSKAKAFRDIKARLNALRILNRTKNDICETMTNDMLAIDALMQNTKHHTNTDFCRQKSVAGKSSRQQQQRQRRRRRSSS